MENIQLLLTAFREESGELLDRLGQLLEQLDALPADELAEVLEEAKRVAHNLKGAALTVGHEELADTTHSFEDELSALEQGADSPEPVTTAPLGRILMQMFSQAATLPGDAAQSIASNLNTGDEGAVDEGAGMERAQDTGETTLKVETQRLDRVMLNAGELLIAHRRMDEHHGRMAQFAADLEQASTAPETAQESLASLAQTIQVLLRQERSFLTEFGHLSQELSEAMKRVRMMPLRNLAPFLRRTVREAAHTLDKQVRLDVQVGNIEIDKVLMDRLRDPLMHLIRNAVDHGVEPTEERTALGKPAQGLIRLRASMQGTKVRIEIHDDGRGLDVQRIATVALARGVITPEQREEMSDRALRSLVFQPSFSTADKVSSVSGRGVGLAVVKEGIEAMGGSVFIPRGGTHEGTTFALISPLTILSISGLLVRAADHIYAIPSEDVERIHSVTLERIKRVDGVPVVTFEDGEPIRIVWLADLVGMGDPKTPKAITVIVLERGDLRVGLAVETVVDEQEYVTKSLPWNLGVVPFINGATILADGGVALSVDVASIFNADSRAQTMRAGTDAAPERAAAPDSTTARPGAHRVLVADDSLASRTLARSILASAGFEVVLTVDGADAWKTLRQEPFDVLVSDINMPAMDGYELTKQVRASSALRGLPIVLVSTLGEPEDIQRGMDAGANDYLIKGQFEQEKLLEAVNQLLDP